MAENRSLPVGCVIMASGLSTRFGSNKLLVPFGPAGEPLLCRALAATATPCFAGRVVVTRETLATGYWADEAATVAGLDVAARYVPGADVGVGGPAVAPFRGVLPGA